MLKNSKVVKFLIGMVFVVGLTACGHTGETIVRLNGNEAALPAELRGLKVYRVQLEGGNWCRVAVLNGTVNSVTHTTGKLLTTTIIINGNTSRTITAKQILSETDSIIVIKK